MFEKNEQCGAVCQESVCQLKEGHHGKHKDDRDGGLVMWTTLGAERVAREALEAQAKQSQQ
jgi:hypothetical protein